MVKSNDFDIGSDDAKVDEHGQWKLSPGCLPGWNTKIKDWLGKAIPDIEEGDAKVVNRLKENLDEPIPEVHENIWEEPDYFGYILLLGMVACSADSLFELMLMKRDAFAVCGPC